MSFVRSWVLSVALALAWPGVCPATPQGKAPVLADVTYDVGDIVTKKSAAAVAQKSAPAARQEEAATGLARELLQALLQDSPGLAKKFVGKDAPYRMQMLNGKRLQVRADKKTQAEVKELLDAFRRTLDVAVDVTCELYEIGRDEYEKQVVGKLPRHPGEPPVFVHPATDETEEALLDGKLDTTLFYERLKLKPLRASKLTLQSRGQGPLFSWRVAVPYERSPGRVFRKPELAFAHPGFSFSVTAVVSGDRRMTHLKLTQKATVLAGWEKVKALQLMPNGGDRDVVFEVPVLQESTFTSTFTALDGWPVVVPVQWRRPGARNSDRQLVLVFSARIRIEEEDRLIREAEEQKK